MADIKSLIDKFNIFRTKDSILNDVAKDNGQITIDIKQPFSDDIDSNNSLKTKLETNIKDKLFNTEINNVGSNIFDEKIKPFDKGYNVSNTPDTDTKTPIDTTPIKPDTPTIEKNTADATAIQQEKTQQPEITTQEPEPEATQQYKTIIIQKKPKLTTDSLGNYMPTNLPKKGTGWSGVGEQQIDELYNLLKNDEKKYDMFMYYVSDAYNKLKSANLNNNENIIYVPFSFDQENGNMQGITLRFGLGQKEWAEKQLKILEKGITDKQNEEWLSNLELPQPETTMDKITSNPWGKLLSFITPPTNEMDPESASKLESGQQKNRLNAIKWRLIDKINECKEVFDKYYGDKSQVGTALSQGNIAETVYNILLPKMKLVEDAEIALILKKSKENPKGLTPIENEIVNYSKMLFRALSVIDSKTTTGYKTTKSILNSLPFMADFFRANFVGGAIRSGIRGGTRTAMKLGVKSAEREIAKDVTKNLVTRAGKFAGDIGKAAVQTTLSPLTPQNMLENYSQTIATDGQYTKNDLIRGGIEAFTENFSERMFGALKGILPKSNNAFVNSLFGNNPVIKSMQKHMNVGGMLEEVSEEYAGDFIKTMFGFALGDEKLAKSFKEGLDNSATTILSIAITSGLPQAIGMGIDFRAIRNTNKRFNVAEDNLKQYFNKENSYIDINRYSDALKSLYINLNNAKYEEDKAEIKGKIAELNKTAANLAMEKGDSNGFNLISEYSIAAQNSFYVTNKAMSELKNMSEEDRTKLVDNAINKLKNDFTNNLNWSLISRAAAKNITDQNGKQHPTCFLYTDNGVTYVLNGQKDNMFYFVDVNGNTISKSADELRNNDNLSVLHLNNLLSSFSNKELEDINSKFIDIAQYNAGYRYKVNDNGEIRYYTDNKDLIKSNTPYERIDRDKIESNLVGSYDLVRIDNITNAVEDMAKAFAEPAAEQTSDEQTSEQQPAQETAQDTAQETIEQPQEQPAEEPAQEQPIQEQPQETTEQEPIQPTQQQIEPTQEETIQEQQNAAEEDVNANNADKKHNDWYVTEEVTIKDGIRKTKYSKWRKSKSGEFKRVGLAGKPISLEEAKDIFDLEDIYLDDVINLEIIELREGKNGVSATIKVTYDNHQTINFYVKVKEKRNDDSTALNGVPDIVDDTPQDARERGFRRVNGYKIDRQKPLQAVNGKEIAVRFSNDVIANGHVAVIDAEQLQPSHIQGVRNPLHFIDEAQPKERNDEASIVSAQRIAKNIRPEEITSSVTAYTGAPIINARGETIQGNNRSDALRLMWSQNKDQAEKYKQYLIDHAQEFGLKAEDIAAMERPILVNMIDVSDEDAIALGQYVAQDTESGGLERIKPKNAVQKMGADMRTFANLLLSSNDDEISFAGLIDKNGVDVLNWLGQKGYITPTQYKSAFDTKGYITAEAKNDLRGIMYQSIFQGGSTRLEEMFNTMPAKAQKAILATAFRDYDSPKSESMIIEIQNSIRAYYALSQSADFMNAKTYKDVRLAVEGWKKQYQIDDATGESYLPAENFSNFALLLATMYKGEKQTLIQGTFNKLYDLIQGTQEADLFETPDNTPRTLSQAIKEVLNIDYNGQQRSNVLVGDTATSQRGEQGSTRDAATRERTKDGERTANSAGSIEAESRIAQKEQANTESQGKKPNIPQTEEAALRDALIDKLREAGIDVITDVEEAQRVLDDANGNEIRQQKVKSYDPRHSISPVRGEWTKGKIIKRLKDLVGSRTGYSFAAKRIAEFDSADELAEHMFYHGTQFGGGRLKPSILMSDRDIERIGGGGYGEKYWGISVSSSKRIASNFSQGRSVSIYPIILVKNANVKEMPELTDAADLEDYIEELWKEGVDAVWIGDKNSREQELCVLNPHAIVNINSADIYKYFKLGTSENPLHIIDANGIEKLYQDAKRYVNALENKPQKPLKPSWFFIENDGKIGEMKSDEQYQQEMSEYEKKLDKYNNSDEVRRFEQEDEYARRNIRFFRTADGNAYGFTVGGKIYIDPRIATADTPIHEYAHLWASAMQKLNPKEWENIVKLMKGTPIWEEVKRNYPELTTDNEIADEVLAFYSGSRGAERLREEHAKILKGNGNVVEKVKAINAIKRVREALKRFWKNVADWFGIHFTTAEEVADKVLSDLLNGVNPTLAGIENDIRFEENSEEADIVARAKADGTYMKAPNGKKSNLSPRQWVQVRTKAFKDWFGDWENDPDNSSKVVDENGEPMVVYHGSGKWFHVFNGKSVIHKSNAADNTIYMSDNREMAESYVPGHWFGVSNGEKSKTVKDVILDENSPLHKMYSWGISREGGIYTLFANIKYPYIVDFQGNGSLEGIDGMTIDEIVVQARKEGYDGVIAKNIKDVGITDEKDVPLSTDIIAFLPNQIKSATDNIGTFDQNNPDIRYSKYFGGNSGYVGYSMSKRAAQAREEGRYPKTDFKKNYGITDKSFNALVNFGYIDNSEWHHTSKFGNKTTFYEWENEEAYDAYKRNKKEIDALTKEYDKLSKDVETEQWETLAENTPIKGYELDANRDWNVRNSIDNIFREKAYKQLQDEGKDPTNEEDFNARVEELKNTEEGKKYKELLNKREELKKAKQEREKKAESIKADIEKLMDTKDIIDDTLYRSDDTMYRIREEAAPKNTGIGYKVFVLKNGELYPPMVANPNGEATPVGVWLDADAAPIAGQSKTGRSQVKAGGKGTQGGSGKLAYRPGWHLGKIPYALQFNRNDENGERTLFPANFVWAEVEYANDVDYHEEAMSYGYNQNGKFQHSYAGLPRVPINGAYTYRTNPNPETDPWIITGAMRVKRLLTPTEVDEMVKAAGREPQRRQEGAITDEQIVALNAEIENDFREGVSTNDELSQSERQRMAERINELADKLQLDNVEIVTDASTLEGNKKRAKGFYSKSTDKITIVIPNHSSVLDVEQTLLHEAVSHYGLRQLFGEHFDTFLDNVFNNADKAIRKRIIAIAAKNGFDLRTATEEYLATLAENTEFEAAQRAGWWQKIKDLFLNMLHRIGFEDFGRVTLTDNELRYILWRSYENLANGNNSILGDATDEAKQKELGVGNYAATNKNSTITNENDIRYRRASNRSVISSRFERQAEIQREEKNTKSAANIVLGNANVVLNDTNIFDEQYQNAIDNNLIDENVSPLIDSFGITWGYQLKNGVIVINKDVFVSDILDKRVKDNLSLLISSLIKTNKTFFKEGISFFKKLPIWVLYKNDTKSNEDTIKEIINDILLGNTSIDTNKLELLKQYTVQDMNDILDNATKWFEKFEGISSNMFAGNSISDILDTTLGDLMPKEITTTQEGKRLNWFSKLGIDIRSKLFDSLDWFRVVSDKTKDKTASELYDAMIVHTKRVQGRIDVFDKEYVRPIIDTIQSMLGKDFGNSTLSLDLIQEYFAIKSLLGRTASLYKERFGEYLANPDGKKPPMFDEFKQIYDEITEDEIKQRINEMGEKSSMSILQKVDIDYLMEEVRRTLAAEMFVKQYIYSSANTLNQGLQGEQSLGLINEVTNEPYSELYQLLYSDEQSSQTMHSPIEIIEQADILIDRAGLREQFDFIGNQIQAILNYVNINRFENGLMSPDTFAKRQLMKDFVNQRGENSSEGNLYEITAKQKANEKMKGKDWFNPNSITSIIAVAQTEIATMEKELLAQRLSYFLTNPNNFDILSQYGMIIDEKETLNEELSEDERNYITDKNIVLLYGERHTDKKTNGQVDKKKINILKRNDDGTFTKVTISFDNKFIGLEEFVKFVNNNFKYEELRGISKAVAPLNAWLSRIYTILSPVFSTKNFFRDLMVTPWLPAKELNGKNSQYVIKNFYNAFNNLSFILKMSFTEKSFSKKGFENKLKARSQELFEYYLEYSKQHSIFSIEDQIGALSKENKTLQDIERALNGKENKFIKFTEQVLLIKFMQHYAELFENLHKFSAYVTLRKLGYGEERSAQIANNATLNYDRSGSIGRQLNAIIPFAKAALGGFYRTKYLLPKYNPKGFLQRVITLAVLGVMQGFMYDPDDDDISEFARKSGMVFGSFLYPLLPEELAIVRPVRALVIVMTGKKSPAYFKQELMESTIDLVPVASDALRGAFSYNPLTNKPEFDVGQLFANTDKMTAFYALAMLASYINENKNSFGKNVLLNEETNTDKTRYGRTKQDYGLYDYIARLYNSILNGVDIDDRAAMSNKIGKNGERLMTIAKEDVEFVINNYIPFGRLYAYTAEIIYDAVNDKRINKGHIPLIGGLFAQKSFGKDYYLVNNIKYELKDFTNDFSQSQIEDIKTNILDKAGIREGIRYKALKDNPNANQGMLDRAKRNMNEAFNVFILDINNFVNDNGDKKTDFTEDEYKFILKSFLDSPIMKKALSIGEDTLNKNTAKRIDRTYKRYDRYNNENIDTDKENMKDAVKNYKKELYDKSITEEEFNNKLNSLYEPLFQQIKLRAKFAGYSIE